MLRSKSDERKLFSGIASFLDKVAIRSKKGIIIYVKKAC